VGEAGVDLVVRPHIYLGRLDDALRLAVPVKDDGL